MKNISEEENLINKENNQPNNSNKNYSNENMSENPIFLPQKLSLEKESLEKKDKSFSSIKLKISEHYEIKSKENNPQNLIFSSKKEIKSQIDDEKNNYINDFYSEESEKNSPKIVDGKEAISVSEIIGEETKLPITLQMLDNEEIRLSPGKISAKSFGVIASYAANTNQGIVRDYNEDRVSVIINMNKPKYYTCLTPWPKISYFGIFDGHAGNKCAEFLRDNLINYICNNNFFPNDVPSAIKYGFKKIDQDYLYKHAFIDNKLIDNSGSCGLILLLINKLIYIANVGDSRCLGSFKNGEIQKDITLDHKPNTPYEKERIIKNGGKIYQTQTTLDDDETYKDKILMGPYRVFPGKLSVSRTVGDAEGKIEALGGNPNVIIPEPDISCFDLEKDDIDFFILGCDGIYDQLYSKDVFKCANLVIKNNLEFFKKSILESDFENTFKGNYGDKINMNNTSGNIVDLILKASMIRKSFDNVTCLFISFKNFFGNIEKYLEEEKLNENININLNEDDNKKEINKEILLKNKSYIENQNNKNNKKGPELIFKEKNRSEIALTKENNNLEENKLFKNKINVEEKDQNINSLSEIKKVKSTNLLNIKKIKINDNSKQQMSNINIHKKLENNTTNLSINQANNKNITDIFLNNENSNKENQTTNYKIFLNSNINSPNNFMNSSNQFFFNKMHITGINFKNKNKKELKYKKNLSNYEDNYRNTSYNKRLSPPSKENSDIFNSPDSTKRPRYILSLDKNKDNINKKLYFKKINEDKYINEFENIDSELRKSNNNIKNNNNDNSKHNIKPLFLKFDKSQKKNNNNILYQNNHNIKFNNIIKTNLYGLANNKINNKNKLNNNNLLNIKNITLNKFKNEKKIDEVKIKSPMPTLTRHLHINKNNKLNDDSFWRQKKFIINNNTKRQINSSEQKKSNIENNKISLNLTNKKSTGIEIKLNNLINKNNEVIKKNIK